MTDTISPIISDRIRLLRARLEPLQPVRIDIRDDSALHAGHAGAKSGGHYHLTIVSPLFSGVGRLKRHRMVNACVADLLENGIHALAIHALSPEQA